MRRLPDHIDRTDLDAVAAFMATDEFDPDPGEPIDAGPLRAVNVARLNVEAAQAALAEAARSAHEAGFSWGVIGAVLGVTRQAARQRFALPVVT